MLGSSDTAVNVGVNAETHIRLANGLVAIEVDLEKAVTPTQAARDSFCKKYEADFDGRAGNTIRDITTATI